jgi:periplasmic protein TonB
MYAETSNGTSRAVQLGLVILLHLLLIWALASGLGTKVVEVVKGPLVAKIIDTPPEQKRDELPPPPPPALDTPPPPFVPPPEITLNVSQTPPVKAIQVLQSKVATSQSRAVIAPRSDPRHPNRKPPYPPGSIRSGEQGTVLLLLYVNVDGEVQDARVDKTSGFEKLDAAAVKYALRAWRFLPAESAGVKVAMWHRVAVTFRLDQL